MKLIPSKNSFTLLTRFYNLLPPQANTPNPLEVFACSFFTVMKTKCKFMYDMSKFLN